MKLRRSVASAIVVLAVLLAAKSAFGQALPAGPYSTPDRRLVLAGEVTGTVGEKDDRSYFNFTDYEHDALRLFRLGLSGTWRPIDRLSFVAEVRSENVERPRVYAAYVRVSPWRTRSFSVQAGRIPPTFGAFGRRTYSSSNALIGYPLAYQYLTSLRADAIPATPDDLLRMRGRGWRSRFPIGRTQGDVGLPLVSAFEWDTGVQATWDTRFTLVSGAITTGTLSAPRVSDDNGGRQVSGRIGIRPITGLLVGVSAARGDWLSRDVERLLPPDLSAGGLPQVAYGVDAEYSRAHWIVQSEIVASRWTMPFTEPQRVRRNLDALGAWIEGRYRLTPRVFAAARADRLGFSRISRGLERPIPWEAPVSRLEVGGGYYLQRNLVVRASVQRDLRDGAGVRHRTFVAAQLSYWF